MPMKFLSVENVCAGCPVVGCPERVMAFLTALYCRRPDLQDPKPIKIISNPPSAEEEPAELVCQFRGRTPID